MLDTAKLRAKRLEEIKRRWERVPLLSVHNEVVHFLKNGEAKAIAWVFPVNGVHKVLLAALGYVVSDIQYLIHELQNQEAYIHTLTEEQKARRLNEEATAVILAGQHVYQRTIEELQNTLLAERDAREIVERDAARFRVALSIERMSANSELAQEIDRILAETHTAESIASNAHDVKAWDAWWKKNRKALEAYGFERPVK